MDKTPAIIITVIILAAAAFLVWYNIAGKTPVVPTPLPAGIVFFYGDTCPHCKDVEDYISANKIDQKVKFTSLEIFENKNNAALAYQVETGCKIDVSQGVEVPLMYDPSADSGQAGKCYLGAPDAINFLKTQAGIQ